MKKSGSFPILPTATSGVNIFSCTNSSGISCHTQDFQNNPVVSSATVGGDTGPYYPPYILDPLNRRRNDRGNVSNVARLQHRRRIHGSEPQL